MKTIRNMSKRMTIKKNLYKIIFTFLFTSVLVFTVPGGFNKVYAAPLEDCDLDGFDDATGVPVPWPGYDETKGDTPDGPAGSKVTPTTAPASTTEGSKDSATPSESSSSDTDKTDSTKANNTNSGSSTKTNSSTKDNTASTGTNKSTTSSNTKSSSTDK
ncbi:MAG: hypothetical protein K0S61_4500, partial [Anaerocolumna sp.]|nr:hypothetical protein [Anaerocolumna sp.]